MKMWWLKIRFRWLMWKKKHRKKEPYPEPIYDEVYYKALEIMSKEDMEAS